MMIYDCYIDPLHPILQAKFLGFPEPQETPLNIPLNKADFIAFIAYFQIAAGFYMCN